MCVPPDAEPPIRSNGAKVETKLITLTASDGNRFAAFAAMSAAPSGAGVVILPDVRGLFKFYEELAVRFAEEGINAVAIDYFGRTAGVGERDADFPFLDHVAQTTAAGVAADTRAAVEYLRSPEGGSCRSIFTVGFCFGGAHSWLQAANGHGLAGAIGFYGRPGPTRDGAPGPAARAKEMTCPVLALMGGADPGIPPEAVDELRQAFQEAGLKHEVVVYPGAPHSFFDRAYEQYAEASADAWQRCLAFIREHSRA
ncbi:MAG: dienelactone hydrolase family protein [Chloroflexota bacterium]|nr:dienelactone hydrolase family protein [Dehalococcoidia bacterium]MDW8252847.1 dienelactone hydrolase family protein [Chloroflexota bacterium]